MKKFNIKYDGGTYNAFYRTEYFRDYEEAVNAVINCNKYGVVYPDLIQITE